jgi:hypothetical protein
MIFMRPNLAFMALLGTAVPVLACADCGLEVSAYQTARSSFAVDASEIYHIPLAQVDFADVPNAVLPRGSAVGDVNFSDLSNVSRVSIRVIDELHQMKAVLVEKVNPLFLKRRPIPPVFLAGAELSLCLSKLERVELDRIIAIVAEKAAEGEARREECIAVGAKGSEYHAEQAELDATMEQLLSDPDLSENPEQLQAMAVLLAMRKVAGPEIKLALECLKADTASIGEEMSMGLGLAMTSGMSMKSRETIHTELKRVFGRELDFGFLQWQEGAE